LTKATLGCAARSSCLLASGCRVVRERLAAAAKIAGAGLTPKAILLHMLGLTLRQWLPVWSMTGELTALNGRIHSLENVPTSRIGAANKILITVDERLE